jgi:hypothetical protein
VYVARNLKGFIGLALGKIQAVMKSTGPTVVTYTWSISSVDGRPAIYLLTDDVDRDVQDEGYIVLGYADTITGMPIGAVVEAAGTSWVSETSIPFGGAEPWLDSVARYNDFLDDALIPFLEALTGNTVTTVESYDAIDATTQQSVVQTVLAVSQTETERYLITVAISETGQISDFGPPVYLKTVEGVTGISGQVTSVIGGDTTLGSIAESLETIAMRDESLTINQNGPIWSAKGRMTTG